VIRKLSLTLIVCALGSFVGAGCGGDNNNAPLDGSVADASDGGGPIDLGPRDSGSRDDSAVDAGAGDNDNSFDTATAITADSTEDPTGVIAPAEDKDYYSFEGTAGTWMGISTTANPDDDDMLVDTVITLYDSARTQIAENDDRQPRGDTDSEIIFRVPATGTYYIEVQDFSDWEGVDAAESHPGENYSLSLFTIDVAGAVVAEDAETGNDAASATAAKFGTNMSGLIVGTFASAADVDVFSVEVTGTERRNFGVQLMAIGDTGNGSTSGIAPIWMTDAAGTAIVARVADATTLEIGPSLPPGSYLLWLQHPATAAGSNDFYVIKHYLVEENAPEAETVAGTNDTIATAEPLTLEPRTDMPTTRNAFILTQLTDTTDVDMFSFVVDAGEQVGIACGAETSGSGVRGLHIELQSATGTVIAMDDETIVDEGALITPSTTTAVGEGTFYARLSKTGQDAEVTSTWVRCGIRALPPAAP
jgi:hypothetical protein